MVRLWRAEAAGEEARPSQEAVSGGSLPGRVGARPGMAAAPGPAELAPKPIQRASNSRQRSPRAKISLDLSSTLLDIHLLDQTRQVRPLEAEQFGGLRLVPAGESQCASDDFPLVALDGFMKRTIHPF